MSTKIQEITKELSDLRVQYEENFHKFHIEYEDLKQETMYYLKPMYKRAGALRDIECLKSAEYPIYIEKDKQLMKDIHLTRNKLDKLKEAERVRDLEKEGLLYDFITDRFFTGFTDCNNNKIYEGDKLKCEKSVLEIVFYKHCVNLDQKGFYAREIALDEEKIYLDAWICKQYEIINNNDLDRKARF